MHLTIGNENSACNARWRHIEKGACERAKQAGGIAIFVFTGLACFRHAGFKLRHGGKLVLHGFQSGIGMSYPKLLALAAIHHHRNDAFQRFAFFIDYDRIEQRQRQCCCGQEADQAAAHPQENGGKHQ